jgi:hypothetical protein
MVRSRTKATEFSLILCLIVGLNFDLLIGLAVCRGAWNSFVGFEARNLKVQSVGGGPRADGFQLWKCIS